LPAAKSVCLHQADDRGFGARPTSRKLARNAEAIARRPEVGLLNQSGAAVDLGRSLASIALANHQIGPQRGQARA
jgi:hypothetical protein